MVVTKKRLFMDMDGTLAEWRSEVGPEELYEKGYFASLRPYGAILDAVKSIWAAAQNGEIDAELFILSAYLPDSSWAKAEKQEWLNEYLYSMVRAAAQYRRPMFDASHTLLVPCGNSKLDYVPGGVRASDYLLDDYTLNLREWEQSGGTPIKVFNGCNGKRNVHWESSVKIYANWQKNYRVLLDALK